ncbi:MAG: glycosyltransferase [Sulfuricurvum sp.]|nr:glycosyltransferase [Sulfuricurvum sp.]
MEKETTKRVISYAKNAEDIMLSRALSDVQHGFYIDVGASDPLIDSVTALFYEKGWRGINIAPLECSFEKHKAHRMWEDNLRHTADLTAVCEEFAPENIHFLKINEDEKGLLKRLDFTRYRPWIILLGGPIETLEGYTSVYFDGITRFYLADEHADRAVYFETPVNILDHFVRYDESIVLHRAQEQHLHWEQAAKKLKKELIKAKQDHKKAHEAHQNLNHQLHLMSHSLSWRTTYPLRIAANMGRRLTNIRGIAAKLKPLLAFSPYLMRLAYTLRDTIKTAPAAAPSPLMERILADRANFLPSDPSGKPRLVFISPLPPAKSGIADYSVRLLGVLREYYSLVVVCENGAFVEPLPFPVTYLSAQDHLMHGSALDRHLYHFGNSHHHLWMLPLLQRFAGTVVLHDLFLGGLYHSLVRQNPTATMERHLFIDHGVEALRYLWDHGLQETLIRYPLNQSLIALCDRVLVHSDYSLSRLNAPHRSIIPFPKEVPSHPLTRAEAKTALGFREDDFVVCSFGFIGSTKCSRELLLAWKESSLSSDTLSHLVFVGELPTNGYADDLLELKTSLPQGSTVTFTGYCTAQRYEEYLCASDLIVQLRRSSRGETSAAAFDALSYGRPLLVNANGTMAEFPEEILIRIPDEFTLTELSQALDAIFQRAPLRERVGELAQEYIKTAHDPHTVARLYHRAIEEGYESGSFSPYRKVLQQGDTANLIPLLAPKYPPRIFVDVSDVASHDLRTGIQRVVRSIFRYLLSAPCAYRIEPVRLIGNRYVHAHTFMHAWMDGEIPLLSEEAVEMGEGDIFLGLDLYVGHIAQNPQIFEQMRSRGVKIHFVVYDILPIRYPSFFPSETYPQFLGWLETITRYCDTLSCISQSVAQDVSQWVESHPQPRTAPLRITSFPLGADLQNSSPTQGITAQQQQMLSSLTEAPIILMVGTIEPRKGHAQALAAMEILWDAGEEIQLVIVGKKGWKVEELIQKIETHPRKNKSLFWFYGASDELLDTLYARSSLLLAASYGEGFGLPLIEAAQHSIPLLVRDIPVFREVAGEHAEYFHGDTEEQLCVAIREYLANPSLTQSGSLPITSWETSARKLLSILEE